MSDAGTFTIVQTRRSVVETRWRWSWRRMHWTVNTLSEDYVFRYDGGCLEGFEDWSPIT